MGKIEKHSTFYCTKLSYKGISPFTNAKLQYIQLWAESFFTDHSFHAWICSVLTFYKKVPWAHAVPKIRDFEMKTQRKLKQYFWKTVSKQSDPWKHDTEVISTTALSALPLHTYFHHLTVQVLNSFLFWNDKEVEALFARQNVPLNHLTWGNGSLVISLSEVINSVVSFTNWSKYWHPT